MTFTNITYDNLTLDKLSIAEFPATRDVLAIFGVPGNDCPNRNIAILDWSGCSELGQGQADKRS